MGEITGVLLLLAGILAGFAGAWYLRSRERKQLELLLLNEQESLLRREKEQKEIADQLSDARIKAASLETELKNHEAKELENQDLEKRFTESFENLAGRILKEKSQSFTELNQKNINDILAPLRERIVEFKDKVEKTHTEGLEKNAALSQKLDQMNELTRTLTREADQLSKALKGENKVQGNWGEMILERILETSGFQDGIHYTRQGEGLKLKDEHGSAQKPDIIINLPDKKHLVIDSKVSLVAYEEWVNADSETAQQEAATRLRQSVMNHIEELARKNYQHNSTLNSPDFVFLFMPIEPVLGIVLGQDRHILDTAWKKHVMIVTPTTMSATLWTISNIWKQENQIQNIDQVYKAVTGVYDKAVLFLESFKEVGTHLGKARESYDNVVKRAAEGKNSFMSQVNKLKEMGVTSRKEIPFQLSLQESEE